MLDLVKIKNEAKQNVKNVTKNITTVNQINEGAVVTSFGAVTSVQSNANETTNLVENLITVKK